MKIRENTKLWPNREGIFKVRQDPKVASSNFVSFISDVSGLLNQYRISKEL